MEKFLVSKYFVNVNVIVDFKKEMCVPLYQYQRKTLRCWCFCLLGNWLKVADQIPWDMEGNSDTLLCPDGVNILLNTAHCDMWNKQPLVPDFVLYWLFQCVDFHLIEYSSRQWFPTANNEELLNNKVFIPLSFV